MVVRLHAVFEPNLQIVYACVTVYHLSLPTTIKQLLQSNFPPCSSSGGG